MRTRLLIGWAVLLGVLGGAMVSQAEEQTDWERIIVPADPVLVKSVPSPGQLRYQTNQLGAFLHYGPAVFLNGDYMTVPDPKVFNPTQLDAEQWVRVAKSFGAKHLVFTAKHHNGFCLWPTKTTDYGVRSCPWKNGRGDLVREVAEACQKQGIALGLYYSKHDQHFPCHDINAAALANREAYWPVCRQQIDELLSNYGDIICLWLDCCGDPFDCRAKNPKTGKLYGDEIVELARAKQPNMVICMGSRPDVYGVHLCREDGTAPYPLWSVLHFREGDDINKAVCGRGADGLTGLCSSCFLPPGTKGWVIPESYNCCYTVFDGKTTNTPAQLMEQYYLSVGRGANLLNALVPDKRGLIGETQVKNAAALGAELRRRFGHPVARTDTSKGWPEPGMLELDLGGAQSITHVAFEEEIAKGQHVLKYAVDVSRDGAWKTVAEGQSLGRKRIERFQPSIVAEKVRLRVVQANAVPSISAMMAYDK